MKKLFSIFIVVILITSCSPASQLEATSSPESTATFVGTKAQLPSPTFTPTLVLTPTLSPDIIIDYQFDSDVDPIYQELIKQGVKLARYYFIENFGSDISNGVTVVAKNRSQTREGFVAYPPGTKPYIYLNTSGDDFKQCLKPELSSHCQSHVVGEFSLYWQWEHGCIDVLRDFDDYKYPLTNFMFKGLEGYVAIMAVRPQDSGYMSDGTALVFWEHIEYSSITDWIGAGDVARVAAKRLIDKHGIMAFIQFCDEIGNGDNPYDAFQSIFGASPQEFIDKFAEDVLGIQKDCTPETCGAQPNREDPRYGSLTPMIDYSLTKPNLIIKIVDQQSNPVADINLQLYRKYYSNVYEYTNGEDNGTNPDGVLSAPVLPGTYGMRFCAPKYPGRGVGYSGHPTFCVYELNPFKVLPGQITTINFQYWDIRDSNLTEPNFLFTLLGVDGLPVSSQYVQVCGYNEISSVCLNGNTDESGIFRASLKPGKYFIRLVQPGQGRNDLRGYANPATYGMNLNPYHNSPEYVIQDIEVEETGVKSITYQYPTPNLQVEFLDANGSPVPYTYFFLCKSYEGPLSQQEIDEKELTNKILASIYSDWDSKQVSLENVDGDCFLLDQTPENGQFKIRVEPGKYFIFLDYMLPDFVVTDDGVTIVSQPIK